MNKKTYNVTVAGKLVGFIKVCETEGVNLSWTLVRNPDLALHAVTRIALEMFASSAETRAESGYRLELSK